MAVSICLPLRLLGAGDAWQPINIRYACLESISCQFQNCYEAWYMWSF
jgi:hypothetical protein